MIKISEKSFSLLKRCIESRQPELIPLIESYVSSDYSDAFYNELREIVGDELCTYGFQTNDEPNEYGLELEALIDEIGRLFLYKIPEGNVE